SLIYAMIEIGNAKETSVGLSRDNPRVKKAALIALDQMAGENNFKPGPLIDALSSADAQLRDTASWIAGRHPEWGSALAGAFEKQMQQQLTADDRDQLRQQLAKLAKS